MLRQSPHYKRPQEVCKLINESFAKLNAGEQEIYNYIGSNEYTFPIINHFEINSEQLLNGLTAASISSDEPLKVLDIGAGNFAFNDHITKHYAGKVTGYGIAANDIYRKKEDRIVDEHHVIANAEYLSKTYSSNSFDLILSCWTFIHFKDWPGAIGDAYKALKVGGLMIIDRLEIPGCPEYLVYLGLYLKQQGYDVLIYPIEYNKATYHLMSSFIIKKTSDKPELLLPLEFDKIRNDYPVYTYYGEQTSETRVVYKPTLAFKQFYDDSKSIKEVDYEKGIHIVNDMINTKQSLQKVVNTCNDLPELFSNRDYQSFSRQDQFLCILKIIEKTLAFKDRDKLYASCAKIGKKSSWLVLVGLINDVICSTTGESLSILTFDSRLENFIKKSKKLSDEEAKKFELKLIQLAAMHEVINLGKQETILTTLKQMGIPYQKNKNISSYDDDIKLSFTHLAYNVPTHFNYEYYVPSLSALIRHSLSFFRPSSQVENNNVITSTFRLR